MGPALKAPLPGPAAIPHNSRKQFESRAGEKKRRKRHPLPNLRSLRLSVFLVGSRLAIASAGTSTTLRCATQRERLKDAESDRLCLRAVLQQWRDWETLKIN